MSAAAAIPPTSSAPPRLAGPVAYGDVTPLDLQRHAGCGVREPRSYAWCAQTHAVPINVAEFGVAALQMPLAFVTDATGQYDAAAVLALRGAGNAFVDRDGRWLAERYIPAYLRCFPFCSFTHGDPALAGERMVCVQEAALETDARAPIISRNGELTAYWKPWAQLIDRFDAAREQTRCFVTKLCDLDLLVPFDAVHVGGDGRRQTLTGLHRVDESRLGALAASVMRELFQSGEMRAIYLHLLSLENLKRMQC